MLFYEWYVIPLAWPHEQVRRLVDVAEEEKVASNYPKG